MRSPGEVLESHLKLREEKNLEKDLEENYDPDIVLLTMDGVFKNFKGVRESAKLLRAAVPQGVYHYKQKYVEGDMAFLVWTADSKKDHICDGADSYLIKNGKIVFQTIYYSVKPNK